MFLLAAFVLAGGGAIAGIIWLIIAACILALLLWIVGAAPFPAPIKQVLTWVIYLVAVLVLINFLLGLDGHAFIVWN